MIKQRLDYFDQMKGLAMIFVVVGHMMLFAFNINPSEPSKFIYFNMPMFFYVSGYLAYKRIETVKELGKRLGKRGMVLLVPYVMFLTLYCVFSGYKDIWGVIIGGGGRYWFLYVLFFISSFFLIYEYLLRKTKKSWIYIATLVLPYLLLIVAKLYLTRNGGENSLAIVTQIVNYYRYYLIGYLCKKYMSLKEFLFREEIIAIGFIAYFLNWYFFELHNMLLIFTGSLGAIIVLQKFFMESVTVKSHIGGVLSTIGRHSLAVYVLHYFFIPDISGIIGKFLTGGVNIFIWQLLFAFLVAIPIVAASVFIGILLEKNKYLNLLFFGKLLK